MRAVAIVAAVLLAGCAHQEVAQQPKARTVAATQDIKSTIVAASIYGYEINAVGTCPCPYSKDRNGVTCGRKSAWSKKDIGAEPRCYRSDVTAEDVKRWRALSRKVPERP